ncbi:HAD-IIB family hydrolase [Chengkuizengella sediminis]|uniref:HAD-IIB family hydrolase n=1 Tax=Chengkuizengella sediminis TaxID=1885917 RepID=UPI00138A2C1E|nr:HAD family hydrolase [Chengkuizengella sediminis]NDI36234.1 HAD family phosphatase [Chengkuizengella sediminis]
MRNEKIKHLCISGLDGTLLNNKTQLSEPSCHQLNILIRNGLLFTVASARSIFSIRQTLKGLSLTLPVIEFGGALITDMDTGHHHVINNIEPNLTNELYHLFSESGFTPLITSFNGKEDCLYYETISNEGVNWYIINRQQMKDTRLKKVELKSIMKDQIVCFTIIEHYEILRELRNKILDMYSNHVEVYLKENPFTKGWFWLTVHDKKATKEHAIHYLLKEYGVNKEQLTVFGSKTSDLNMFKIAKNRIAVSNAKPELKEAATKVIGSNNEDSVVNYILNSV